MKPGEEGRGGKVLLKDAADEGLLYASFEILGMAEWTESGIVTIHPDNISYNDNSDYKRNWSAMLTGDTWELLYEWLEENRSRMEEMQEFSS